MFRRLGVGGGSRPRGIYVHNNNNNNMTNVRWTRLTRDRRIQNTHTLGNSRTFSSRKRSPRAHRIRLRRRTWTKCRFYYYYFFFSLTANKTNRTWDSPLSRTAIHRRALITWFFTDVERGLYTPRARHHKIKIYRIVLFPSIDPAREMECQ